MRVQAEEAQKALQPLTEFMKGVLGEKVEKVTVSQRLADSPSALVTSKFGWSAQQERVMRSQVCPAHSLACFCTCMRGQAQRGEEEGQKQVCVGAVCSFVASQAVDAVSVVGSEVPDSRCTGARGMLQKPCPVSVDAVLTAMVLRAGWGLRR